MKLGRNAPKGEKSSRQRVLQAVILCWVLFFMLLAYFGQPRFITDEGDVFYVGKGIACGQLLYRDIISQHMPFTYYIAAVFYLLGARTYGAMQVCFYGLLSVLWGGMYYRYSDRFGKKAMVIYPVLYVVMLSRIPLAYAMLSEQLQAIGFVLLLLELLQFAKTRRIGLDTSIIVSLAIVMSFGTTFVSAFAVMFVFLTVMAVEISDHIRQKTGFISMLRQLFQKYWKLVAICVAPFALMVLLYAATGTLDDFVSWAYTVNRVAYPKYNGGYGGSIIGGVYRGWTFLLECLSNWTLQMPEMSYTLICFMAVVFFVKLWREYRDPILILGVLAFLIGTATRGVFEFHGVGCVAVMCMMIAIVAEQEWNRFSHSTWRVACIAACVLVVASSYFALIPTIASVRLGRDETPGTLRWAIDANTEKFEKIGNATLHIDALFESHALTTEIGAACPWIWEWGGQQRLENLRQNPPRVILYDENTDVWGSRIVDFAGDLDAFMKENYTSFPEYNLRMFYVRNDCYAEAKQKFADAGLPAIAAQITEDGWGIELTLSTSVDFDSVEFPVWTFDGGQDDLHFYQAEKQSDGTWKCIVDLHDHMETGDYVIHSFGCNPGQMQFIRELRFAVKELPEE